MSLHTARPLVPCIQRYISHDYKTGLLRFLDLAVIIMIGLGISLSVCSRHSSFEKYYCEKHRYKGAVGFTSLIYIQHLRYLQLNNIADIDPVSGEPALIYFKRVTRRTGRAISLLDLHRYHLLNAQDASGVVKKRY